MSSGFFLLVTAIVFLTLGVVSSDDNGKTCPYYGEKNQTALDTVNSKEFQKNLSVFNLLFIKSIPSANFFFKLFDVSFNPKTVYRTFFLNCVYYGVNMGLKCPINLCKDMASKVDGAFKKGVTMPDYVIVMGNTLSSSLTQEGNLKSMDVAATSEMIKKFFDDVAKNVCKPDVKGPIQSLFGLDDGAKDFFKGLGVINIKDVKFIAKEFGKQFAAIGNPNAQPTESPHLLELKAELLGIDIRIL